MFVAGPDTVRRSTQLSYGECVRRRAPFRSYVELYSVPNVTPVDDGGSGVDEAGVDLIRCHIVIIAQTELHYITSSRLYAVAMIIKRAVLNTVLLNRQYTPYTVEGSFQAKVKYIYEECCPNMCIKIIYIFSLLFV